jgi:hypothetical protein
MQRRELTNRGLLPLRHHVRQKLVKGESQGWVILFDLLDLGKGEMVQPAVVDSHLFALELHAGDCFQCTSNPSHTNPSKSKRLCFGSRSID